jgi:hypothetical protein
MIEGFDKEMDALLRQTAKGEAAPAGQIPQFEIRNPKSENHLDPDEISAFAENALPEKTRLSYTAHFADCDRCRKILSNLIALNAEETETTTASPVITERIAAKKEISWYRRLFAVPNLAYTLGALVVLFGGFFAFLILQNANNQSSSEVSQISESRPGGSGPNAESEPGFYNANVSASNSTTAVSNTATASNTTVYSTNSAANVSTGTAARSSNAASTTANTAPEPARTQSKPKKENAKTETADESDFQVDGVSADASKAKVTAADAQVAERAEDEEKTMAAQAAPPRNTTPTVPPAAPPAVSQRQMSDMPAAKMKRAAPRGAGNRQIGGKNFARKDGVWYDSAYSGQSTTNVRRGTNEYKNLDSELRSITDNLDGTIVVLWKSKAYRIQ